MPGYVRDFGRVNELKAELTNVVGKRLDVLDDARKLANGKEVLRDGNFYGITEFALAGEADTGGTFFV